MSQRDPSRDEGLPVIMRTSKGGEIDKVLGLQLGANDYVTKPFGVCELLVRIEAVLRRSQRRHFEPDGEPDVPDTFVFGRGQVQAPEHRLRVWENSIDVSPRELKILQFFYTHRNQVVSRDDLLTSIWGAKYYAQPAPSASTSLRYGRRSSPIPHAPNSSPPCAGWDTGTTRLTNDGHCPLNLSRRLFPAGTGRPIIYLNLSFQASVSSALRSPDTGLSRNSFDKTSHIRRVILPRRPFKLTPSSGISGSGPVRFIPKSLRRFSTRIQTWAIRTKIFDNNANLSRE